MKMMLPVFLILIFALNLAPAAEGAINYGPIRRGNGAPPSNPGNAPPANRYQHGCNPGDHCRGSFLSLLKDTEIRILPDAGDHTEGIIEAVVAAFAESLKKENASEPPRVLIWFDSNSSTPMFQDAIRRGIAGKGLQSEYRLPSSLTPTEDEASFHPVNGHITMKASLDLVDLKFSTPDGPLGATEMVDILESAAEINWRLCPEGPCSEKIKLILEVNLSHPYLEGRSFQHYGQAMLKHLENYTAADPKLQKVDDEDGVRALGFGGWFLVELSVHHPVLQLYIEVYMKVVISTLV